MFRLKKNLTVLVTSTLFLTLSIGIVVASAEAPSASESYNTSGEGTVMGCGVESINEEDFSFQTFVSEKAIDKGVISASEAEDFIAGARIVELSESLPGTDNVVGESFLIDAYKGICCTKSDDTKCVDYAYTYSDSLDKCAENSEKDDCRPVQLLVSTSGINLLKFYVLQVYIWAASVVGIIAVLVIVVSGIQIAASGGEEQLTSARTRIMQSLAGLAILFLSGLILYTINPTFFTS